MIWNFVLFFLIKIYEIYLTMWLTNKNFHLIQKNLWNSNQSFVICFGLGNLVQGFKSNYQINIKHM